MSFQAYLTAVEARTGHTVEELRALARGQGLLAPDGTPAPGVRASDLVAWLARDFELGRGHAMAVWALFSGSRSESGDPLRAGPRP